MRRHLLAGSILAVASATPALAVSFTDGAFVPANYTTQIVDAATAGNSLVLGQCATCGVAGGAGFSIAFGEPNGIGPQMFGAAVNSGFSYTPTTQGAISSISASVDKNFTVNNAVAYNNTFRPIIYQNGSFYSAVQFNTPITGPGSTGYLSFTISGLSATDFTRFDVSTDAFVATDHPDFSGSTILLGIGQVLASTFASETVVNATFDNLAFTLTPAAVPEPASASLLVLAVGLTVFGARKRVVGLRGV